MKNLENQRFGCLIAVKRLPGGKWLCHCDCGNEKDITTSNLINGRTKSCGCIKIKIQHDITGQRFGRFVVKERVNARKWRCLCDCNRVKVVSKYSLFSGTTQSCGCLHKEIVNIDITGQRFEHLVAIEPTGKSKNGSTIWRFLCDCGNITEATIYSVKWGNRKSCGCTIPEIRQKSILHAQEHVEHIDGTVVNYILSKKLRKDNTSGHKGVCWHKRTQKWGAEINFKGKRYYLGDHEKIEDAVKARSEAEERLHGPFLEWYVQRNKDEI